MKRLLGLEMLLAALFCIGTIIRADEIKIEQCYEAASDLSASMVQNQRKDMNGNVCALVKVALPLNGAVFEGNVVGDVEFKAGEYWVYMTPGTKMLRIKHETATPTMIDFPDYGIPALESKTTYALVLTPPNVGYNKGDGANGSYLVLDITPKTGVVVEVDGDLVNVEGGTASTFLQYGNHEFTVKAKGYETYTGTAKIEKGMNTTIPVKLESNMASLTVKPETSGAITKINGTQIGTGTFTESIAPGTYLVEVENPGYTSWSETITLSQRENKTLNVPALRPIYGSLNIDFKPVGATVSIDGKEVGTTPAMIGDLLIGNHTVTVSQEGYTPFTTTITISEAETSNLSGSLKEGPIIEQVNLKPKQFWNGFEYKWGYVDENGNTKIPFFYGLVKEFSEGFAVVKLLHKWGFIDETGKEITPIKYDAALDFSEGLAAVKLKKKWGFIDKTGNEVIPFIYDDELYEFSEGVAAVKLKNKWGFIDKKGTEVIPFKYEHAFPFSEGLALVKHKGKWGFIDRTGKEIIPVKFDDAKSFNKGKAKVKLNGRDFYIDKNGNEVIN